MKALESRVAWLETQLGAANPSQSRDHLSGDGSATRASSAVENSTSSSPVTTRLDNTPNLANSVGLLSLHAAAEPQYFGVSSGVSLALMIETAVYEKARPSSSLSLAPETDSPFSTSSPRGQTTIAPLPSLEQGTSFIDAYLSHIHPQFPFLSKLKLWEAHSSGRDLDDSATDDARHWSTVLQLVYAIGSRCLQLIGSPSAIGVEPEGQYCAAIAKVQDRLNVPSVQNIQIILLVAIYALRSPSGTSRVVTCLLHIPLYWHRIIARSEPCLIRRRVQCMAFMRSHDSTVSRTRPSQTIEGG